MRHKNSRLTYILTYMLKGKRETAVRLAVATPRSRGNKSSMWKSVLEKQK